MGIRGFSSFVAQNPNISITQQFKLHDTTVIFDGSSLIHFLYYKNELDFKYGGDYHRYSECIRMYISSFLECNIKPIMIFDGGQENTNQRLESTLGRVEERLKYMQIISNGESCTRVFLPLLAIKVFYSVLFDLGIQLANCDYSADSQVASLGNYYECPVISNDSDFYILDAHKGFIQLRSIDTKIISENNSDGRKYKFLNCEIYYIDKFVNAFPGLDKNILPLFGTLIGNDFVEPKTFYNFFAKMNLPTYERDKKIVGLLRWLQHKTLDEAVRIVISTFERRRNEDIKSVIDFSLCEYNLNSSRLPFLLDLLNQNMNDPRNDLLSESMLTTRCKNQLPQSFVLKFHQGRSPGFLINIVGLHRVFLRPQVEDMELESIHSCSSYIRQIMYGILVRHDINGTECCNPACRGFIEEYDRKGCSIQKKKVLPISSVEGIGLLPKINEVCCTSKEQCIAIVAKALGVSSDFFLSIPDSWQLFIGSLNCWLRISGCRSEAFISAVILNLIYFDLVKCKNQFLDQTCCQKKMLTSGKCAHSSIASKAANISESSLRNADKMLEEYYINPTLNRQHFPSIVHSFNQLQSCILYSTFLNHLLNDCLKHPAPDKCFSGAMIYSLTEAIASRPSADQFIGELLGTDLYLLFTDLKSKVCENVH